MDKHDKHHKPKHGHDKHAHDIKAGQQQPQAMAQGEQGGTDGDAPVIAPHGKHVKKH